MIVLNGEVYNHCALRPQSLKEWRFSFHNSLSLSLYGFVETQTFRNPLLPLTLISFFNPFFSSTNFYRHNYRFKFILVYLKLNLNAPKSIHNFSLTYLQLSLLWPELHPFFSNFNVLIPRSDGRVDELQQLFSAILELPFPCFLLQIF